MDSCTGILVGSPHPWPAPVLKAHAASESASSNTMLADLPPSSTTTGLGVSAHGVRISLAVASPGEQGNGRASMSGSGAPLEQDLSWRRSDGAACAST